MEQSNESIIEQFLMAAESGDLDGIASLAHDDVVMEWPQSGELFRGKDNAIAALRAQEVKPEFAGEPRMIGSGDVWVVMVPLRYGDEIHHYVGVYELRDGKVAHSTEYFGAPFPPRSSAPSSSTRAERPIARLEGLQPSG